MRVGLFYDKDLAGCQPDSFSIIGKIASLDISGRWHMLHAPVSIAAGGRFNRKRLRAGTKKTTGQPISGRPVAQT
jgi:hypothetical protein